MSAISLRSIRNFHGSAPISLHALSALEGRTFPVSVRDLALNFSRTFNGNVTAGDVQCTYKMSVFRSGHWAVSADLFDDGTFAGDSFVLEFAFEGSHGIGTKLEGELGAGDRTTVGDRGVDPWIRDNWGQTHRLTHTLHGAWLVGDVFGIVVTALAALGAAIFFGSPGETKARRCQDQPFDDHQPCVEFYKDQP